MSPPDAGWSYRTGSTWRGGILSSAEAWRRPGEPHEGRGSGYTSGAPARMRLPPRVPARAGVIHCDHSSSRVPAVDFHFHRLEYLKELGLPIEIQYAFGDTAGQLQARRRSEEHTSELQ